jgi:hypothetical protein
MGFAFERETLYIVTYYPSDLSLSLHFSVKASARREGLKNAVLKPWQSLHGIRKLALSGDTGNYMHQHLQKSMLQGPFPTEVAFTMSKYHTMMQNELVQKNYSSAQCGGLSLRAFGDI